MKILENRSILKKILLVLVIIILIEFSIPNVVSQASRTAKAKEESGWGGTLFTPVQSLVLALGDVCEIVLNLSAGNNLQPILTLFEEKSTWVTVLNGFVGGSISNSFVDFFAGLASGSALNGRSKKSSC